MSGRGVDGNLGSHIQLYSNLYLLPLPVLQTQQVNPDPHTQPMNHTPTNPAHEPCLQHPACEPHPPQTQPMNPAFSGARCLHISAKDPDPGMMSVSIPLYRKHGGTSPHSSSFSSTRSAPLKIESPEGWVLVLKHPCQGTGHSTDALSILEPTNHQF